MLLTIDSSSETKCKSGIRNKIYWKKYKRIREGWEEPGGEKTRKELVYKEKIGKKTQ
jgi:hypothetical protein